LPPDLPALRSTLFDAYVAQALAWTGLGSIDDARAFLGKALRITPERADSDAHYWFAAGQVEPRVRVALRHFERAAELDEKMEAALFLVAIFVGVSVSVSRSDIDSTYASGRSGSAVNKSSLCATASKDAIVVV
jgi:tetratricopeptide (TPR) repeat protein